LHDEAEGFDEVFREVLKFMEGSTSWDAGVHTDCIAGEELGHGWEGAFFL